MAGKPEGTTPDIPISQWGVLLDIKGSLGEIKGNLGGVKSDIAELKAMSGIVTSDVSDIRVKVASLETVVTGHAREDALLVLRVNDLVVKVEAIHTKDLPEIRQQMAVSNWLKSNRNKVFAALGATLLGVAGSFVGGILQEKAVPSAVISSASAQPPKAAPQPQPQPQPSPLVPFGPQAKSAAAPAHGLMSP